MCKVIVVGYQTCVALSCIHASYVRTATVRYQYILSANAPISLPHQRTCDARPRLSEAHPMDSSDYIADLEGEVQVLQGRIVGLEEELRSVRDELRVAHERKVEEVSKVF